MARDLRFFFVRNLRGKKRNVRFFCYATCIFFFRDLCFFLYATYCKKKKSEFCFQKNKTASHTFKKKYATYVKKQKIFPALKRWGPQMAGVV